MRKYLKIVLFFFLFTAWILPTTGQRKMEKLDRGVVAVKNSGSSYLISWRYLVSDPEDVQFNVYRRRSGIGQFVKLNSSPLTATNLQTPATNLPVGTEIYVKPIVDGVEQDPSTIFTVNTTGFRNYRSVFLDITYNPAQDGLALADYTTKFCWPVDLDGDGEYDYVVDRLNLSGGTDKVQAYLRDGTLLWTIDMGPNVNISDGHNDMVIAYDMDCDGKGEVVIKSSDGTRFWDKATETWGKYLLGAVNGDTDNDGMVNYETQNTKNPPQYITVVNGMTGEEMNTIEMHYPSDKNGHAYTRTNKSIYMGDDYSKLTGHMAIAYLDGIHPSVVMEHMVRTNNNSQWGQYHHYYATAWGYKFENGSATDWEEKYHFSRTDAEAANGVNYAEFHHIRVGDVNFDGLDEMLDGGFALKADGTPLFSAGIAHGDRFRVGDMDPERPGLETFAIQQNASDMLGMILYDSGTGEPIKKWYMGAVGDVGRGECMDIDPANPGYEIFSTMGNIYNAKGDMIYAGSAPFPREGVWWDGDLLREDLDAPDGNGFNAHIRKHSLDGGNLSGSRLIEFAKMVDYRVRAAYGTRPAFFGDIMGDWREEIILEKTIVENGNPVSSGFVGFSTDYPTEHRLYCLMQNPAYRMQATTKAYYQSAYPDFYLGAGMPEPPIPAVQVADLRWKAGNTWDKTSSNFVSFDLRTTSAYTDGKEIMFDISGNNTNEIELTSDIAPAKVWAMNPKGKDYVLKGSGKLTGDMELVKSMYGVFTLKGNHTYTGRTIISEGTLVVNGSLESPVDLRAKGTLMGNAILNGGVNLQESLNIEGGRLSPGNGLERGKLGKMTINGNVVMAGKVNIGIDIIPEDALKNDSLVINGDLTLSGKNKVVIHSLTDKLEEGTYSLLTWTGELTGGLDNFELTGLSGFPMDLKIEDKTLVLEVHAVRSAGSVIWKGIYDGLWDYKTKNFLYGSMEDAFVPGDAVSFTDDAINQTITINETMSVSGMRFTNQTDYTVAGNGILSGDGGIVKTGTGKLSLLTTENTFTGGIDITDGTLEVASLKNAGEPSSIGASSGEASNWIMRNATLQTSAQMATNRNMQIHGKLTVDNPTTNNSVLISGNIEGANATVEVKGKGSLTLQGRNTLSEVIVTDGLLLLGSIDGNSYAVGTAKVTLEGGIFRMFNVNSTSYTGPFKNEIHVPEGATALWQLPDRWRFENKLTGGGTITVNAPYVRSDFNGDWSAFEGVIKFTGSDVRLNNAAARNMPHAEINLSASLYVANNGSNANTNKQTFTFGALSGTGTVAGAHNLVVGSRNTSTTFSGVIGSGSGKLTKRGTGSFTLSGNNEYTGGTAIEGGKLIVANTAGSATGTGTVTVGAEGVLAGTGTIAGKVSLLAGSTLMAGPSETAIGTLTMRSDLVLDGTSTTVVKVRNTTSEYDKYTVGGNVAVGGTLTMRLLEGVYTSGQTFQIVKAAGNITGAFAQVIPATPGEGLAWDLSRLTEGIVAVMVSSGIDQVDKLNVNVHPTLVEDICYVSLYEMSGTTSIEVINQSGEVIQVKQAETADSPCKINMGGYSPGLYFLRIKNAEKVFVLKVIKK